MSATKNSLAETDDSSPYLVVVDSHAMAYRSYYALQNQNLHHPHTGMPTHAIYGFLRMFFYMLLEYAPKHCVLAWDPPGPNFRNQLYSDYKATRKPMPDDLRTQIEEIKQLLQESGFCNLEVADYEADDVIGSLAKHFSDKGKVLLITSDKDCYQLLSKQVSMLRSNKGLSDFIIIDPNWVVCELGIQVSQVTDYMGLVGDTSDNIPGVQGIGPKSAAKLLEQYGSLPKLYEQIEAVTPKSLRTKLQDNQDKAFLSQKLATIKTSIPQVLALKEKQVQTPNFLNDKTLALFREQGYNQIYLELKKAQKQASSANLPQTTIDEGGRVGPSHYANAEALLADGQLSYTLVSSVQELKDGLAKLRRQMATNENILALDSETTSINANQARIVGLSLCAVPRDAIYISLIEQSNSLFGDQQGLYWQEARPILKKFLEDKSLKIIGQNLKYDYLVLKKWGVELPPPYFDTMIASYLCQPNVRRHNLDDMASDLLGYQTITYEDIVGKGAKKKNIEEISPEQVCVYACEDADISLGLYYLLKDKISKHKLESLYNTIELPLVSVLIDMESEGVAIDQKYFTKLSTQYSKKIEDITEEIYRLAGYHFNIQSTRELQKILFEDLNLPKGKKTKTGYSTDQKVLENLSGLHPLVDNILEHRKYSKLISTYIDALPALIDPQTGRIHTSFNQTIASTGRLSSVQPNLQNIPIREDEGRAIRQGFVPHPGNILISMDYSQIELRIMAHFSSDSALIESFTKEDKDIHRSTAASLFDVPEQEVTADMRAHGKVVNFAIIYGVTKYGLSRTLKVDQATAERYIDRFFIRYPGVRSYMDNIVTFAQEKGYVQTLTGRIRPIPNIKDSNHFRREGAQRTAINTPIQGTSADIIKIAMIGIQGDIKKKKMASRMILQVHDELLFDVDPKEEQELSKIAKNRMENAVSLDVPLLVESGRGKNWDEAH